MAQNSTLSKVDSVFFICLLIYCFKVCKLKNYYQLNPNYYFTKDKLRYILLNQQSPNKRASINSNKYAPLDHLVSGKSPFAIVSQFLNQYL